jgi:hypothetical protein
MSRQNNEAQQWFYELPPMVKGSGTETACFNFAAGQSAVIVDLTSYPVGTQAKASITIGNDDYNPNPTGHFLYLEAQGCDIYVAFGPSFASLSGISATAVSTVNGSTGVITPVTGGTFCIPQGKAVRWKIPPSQGTPDNADVGASSPARFLGFITTTGTSGILQTYQSSP